MAGGLDLGKAYFNFGLDSLGAAKGLADFARNVSSTTARVVPEVKGISNGFDSISNTIGGTFRSVDRFTRGLRGVSPAMAAHRENIYRLEDAQRRLNRDLDIARLRLNERRQAEQANTESIKRLNDRLTEQRNDFQALNTTLNDAKVRLRELQTSTTLHAEAVSRQEQAVNKADANLEAYQRSMAQAQLKITDLTEREKTFATQLDTQEGKIAGVVQKLSGMSNEVQQHIDQISKLRTTYQNATAVEEQQQRTVDRLRASYESFSQQAANASVELLKLQERSPTNELRRQEAEVRRLAAVYEQQKIEVGQASQALSNLSKQGKQNTTVYRDQQLLARELTAERDRMYANLQVQIGRVKQLEIAEREFNTTLDSQRSKIDLFLAKSREEQAAMVSAQGKLETLRASHRGIATDIESHERAIERLRLQEAQLQVQQVAEREKLQALQREQQAQIAQRLRLEAEYDKQILKSNELAATLGREQQALAKLRTTTGASEDEINKQAAAVDRLERAYRSESAALESTERQLGEATNRQARLNRETVSQEKAIRDIGESQQRYAAQLTLAKEREDNASVAAERRAQRMERLKQKVRETADGHQRLGGLLGWITGLFGRSAANMDRMSASTQRMTSITQAVNQRLFSLSSILRDLAVGTVSGFFANTLSGWLFGLQRVGTTALDAFKSHEMLSMSLRALQQRQLVTQGQFATLAEAEGQAGVQAEALIKWMEQLAIKSPFSVEDISATFRLGNALGFTSQQAQRLIRDTVDWAAASGGTAQSIESVVRALGQMNQTGHVTLEDLNQMTDAGLAARQVLREEFAPEIRSTGKSLEDLISAGIVPADRAIRAIALSMERDFGGSADKAGNSMSGLLSSLTDLKNSGLRTFFESTFKAIQGPLSAFVTTLQSPATLAAIQQFGSYLGTFVGNTLSWISNVAIPTVMAAIREFGPQVMDAFAFLAALASEAYAWGAGIGREFANGLADTIDMIVGVIESIGSVIASWMAPSSPPKFLPLIDVWGQETGSMYVAGFEKANMQPILNLARLIAGNLSGPAIQTAGVQAAQDYMQGWGASDFSVLSDVMRQVQSSLGDMVDISGLDKGAMLDMMLGTEAQVARAIAEMKQFGGVAEETYRRIAQAAGPAGSEVEAYVRALMQNEVATRSLKAAQDQLTAITSEYDAKLASLRAKLAGLQGTVAGGNAVEKEKLRLTQMLARMEATRGFDEARKAAIRNRLEQIAVEEEIAHQEQLKDAAVESQQAKVDAAQMAADSAAEQLTVQQAMLEAQHQQNDLIRQQIQLAEQQQNLAIREAESAEKQAEKDIREAEAQAKKEEAARKREEAALQRQHEAEYQARLAGATSEEERLRIMQEEQQRYQEGTVEYLKVQKQIEVQQDKVAKVLAKATEAEVDHALAMADNATKTKILEERLASLDPTTAEYAKRQEQLKKATDAQTAAEEKLTDAAWEAQLAGQDRAGKIDMLREKLGTLTVGSLEYEKTLKRLNTLEQQGGGGRRKGKSKDLLAGTPFEGMNEGLQEVQKTWTDTSNTVSTAVDRIKTRFADFRARIEPFFAWLRENSQIISFVVQRLGMAFLAAIAIEKVVRPLLSLVWGLRQFLTWGNAVWALMALLGYSWKYNLGGLRDIVIAVWGRIQAPLENIKNIFTTIAQAFERGGISAAWDALREQFGQLAINIGLIGATVWEGIIRWTGPLLAQLGGLVDRAAAWVQGGGLDRLANAVITGIQNAFGGSGAQASIITGLLGLLGGLQVVFTTLISQIVQNAPAFYERLVAFLQGVGKWLSDHATEIMDAIGLGLGALIAGALEAIIPTLVFLVKRLIDVTTWLIPMLPTILGGVVTLLTSVGAWIIARGIPLLVTGMVDLLTYLIRKLGEMLPSLGVNLGRLIGSTLSKLLIMLVTGLGALVVQLFLAIQDGSLKQSLDNIGAALGTFFVGFLQGLAGLLLGLVAGLFEPFIEIGKVILLSIGQGLDENTRLLIETAVAMFDEFVLAIKEFLGIASPSALFMGIGMSIIQGVIDGMNSLIASLTGIITSMLEAHRLLWDAMKLKVIELVDGLVNALVGSSGWFVKLKDDLIRLANDIWNGLVSASGWFTKLVADIKRFFSDLLGAITGSAGSFAKLKADLLRIANDIWNGLVGSAGWIAKLIADAKKLFDDLRDGLVSRARTMRDNVVGAIKDIWNGAVGPEGWLTKLFTTGLAKWDEFVAGVKGKLEGLITWLSNTGTFAQNLLNAAVELGASILGGIRKGIENNLENLKNYIVGKIKGWINSIISSITSGSSTSTGPTSSGGAFAMGTQYARGGLSLVGEDGPELVNLPRGSEVLTNSRTMDIFREAARIMIAQVSEVVRAATISMVGATEIASGQLIGAAEESSRTVKPSVQQTVVDNSVVKTERHDHWNLTVNSKASVPSVVTDYSTMRAIAGATH